MLKIVAIVGMTCNHVANIFAVQLPAPAAICLYALGGLTFPIMAFLLTEGYTHTSSVHRYAGRLAVFAVVSQVPYSLLWGATGNVLFTLLLGLGILWADEHVHPRGLFACLLIGAIALSGLCDWGVLGPVLIFLFWKLHSEKHGIVKAMLVPVAAVGLSALLSLAEVTGAGAIGAAGSSTVDRNTFAQLGTFVCACGDLGYVIVGFGLATLALATYNGKRGRPMKWLFYVYYPAHLTVLWVISIAIA